MVSAVTAVTSVYRLGYIVTMPSRSNRCSASRTGVRDTCSSSATSTSRMRSPAASVPSMICLPMWWKTSSAKSCLLSPTFVDPIFPMDPPPVALLIPSAP